LDRDFYSKAVKLLDEEVIENVSVFGFLYKFLKVEMNIAETCLNSYSTTRQQILQSRLRFLEKKNKSLQSSVT